MAEGTEVPVVTLPTWLYFQRPDGRMLSQVFDDEVSYDAARKAGWHSSPASFGVETHPSQPGVAAAAQVVSPSPTSVDLSEVTALLLAMQVQQEHANQAIRDLTARVVHLEQPPEPHPAHVAHTVPRPTEHHDDDKPAASGRK
jgi:hypothetical protein